MAAAAVTLCTAMVIIVISVMGGFLENLKASFQKLTGDVIVYRDVAGMPYYQELMAELATRPGVAASTPIVRAYGLISLEERVHTVEIEGVDPPSLDRVIGYRSTLYWTSRHYLDELNQDFGSPESLAPERRRLYDTLAQRFTRGEVRDWGMTFQPPDFWGTEEQLPGCVLGIEVSPYNRRLPGGAYPLRDSTMAKPLTLTVLPITTQGTILDPAVKRMVVVNEFKSGLYDRDASQVYVPFALLQAMLKMDGFEEIDPQTGRATGKKVGGRATEVMVRGQAGVDLEEVRRQVREAVEAVQGRHPDAGPMFVMTWKQRHQTLLGAVEKEKFMVTILFAIISIVAVAMIGVIFSKIVTEKTRDIGVLRSLGASRSGIAGVFIGYGAAIGVLGALLGLGLAAAVVRNINEIQDFLGRTFGFVMWNPDVYYFDRIPDSLDPMEVGVILACAVIASVLGAVIPAVAAAIKDPVAALRYE